jgi:hypothetical protein
MVDAAAKADELALRKEEVKGRLQLDSMKIGAKIQDDKTKLAAQQSAEGVRLGIDVAKTKAQTEMQQKQAALQHLQHVHNMSRQKQSQEKPTTEKKPK